MFLLSKKRHVLGEGCIPAGMPWLTAGNGKICHSQILKEHVHDYYQNKSMQQIYGYNIFPVVQDQIRYDGETNPPTLGMQQPGQPKNKTNLHL